VPGFTGAVIQAGGLSRQRDRLKTFSAAALKDAGPAAENLVDPAGRWFLARTHLGILQPERQLAGESKLRVLFHGDIWNAGALTEFTRPGCGPGVADRPHVLCAALYERLGDEFAATLKGAFSAIVLDEARDKLLLVNDRLGSYPLYWSERAGLLSFSSELRILMRDPGVKKALDLRAVADYLAFGFVMGDKTLAEGVSLLPPSSVLRYSMAGGTVSVTRYHERFAWLRPGDCGGAGDALERLVVTFRQAVARGTSGGHKLGLSLSGGLDSRAALAAIDCMATPITTRTVGAKGCADETIAAKLAAIAGSNHGFVAIDDRYVGDYVGNLRHMVSLSDGFYVSHGLTEMRALSALEKEDTQVLLRGHGAELAKTDVAWPLHSDARTRRLRTPDQLSDALVERSRHVMTDVSLGDLFRNDLRPRVDGMARQSLTESLAGAELTASEAISHLYLFEYHRRFSVPSLQVFRSRVEVRMPFVDEDFLQALFQLPAAARMDTSIHRHLIGALKPAMNVVRNSNTGAPADAGPVVAWVADKLNTMLKRLRVRGFRHYHDFDAWMAERLIEPTQALLLAKDSFAREIFRDSTLERLVADTRGGDRRRGYLLQLLLVLELWQQENFG
jgi:asparagine synthase (glutamine-hydrolysing)